MLRPLWDVAVLFAGGIVAGWWLAWPAEVILLSFGLSLGAAWLARPAPRWLLAVTVVLAGWADHAAHTAVVSTHDLRAIAGATPELVTVRGRIVEPPVERVFHPDTDDETWTTQTALAVEAWQRQGAWRPVHGVVAVTARDRLSEEFIEGRRVEVYGVLAPPRGALAEGLFDYAAWLRLRGIYFQLQTQRPSDWRLLDSPEAEPWTVRFARWAKDTLQRGLPVEDEPLRLGWAMALGWKTALTDEVAEPYMRSGTMHLFAISGLHVAFIAGILLALLRVARLPRLACGLIVVPCLWFYTAATGWQPSAMRSTIMMTVIITGWAWQRPGDLLNSLGAAAFIILVIEPGQLFQASFQLSFFVVLGLALFLPPTQEALQRILARDPLLPPELRPRWQRWLDRPARWLVLGAATSFAAWLGSLPLTAYYFNLFTPLSLLANLVIVPVSSGALACHLGSLVCAGWLPWAGELFNHAGWALMWLMNFLSGWFASRPGACWHVRAPAPWEMAGAYALMGALISGWMFRHGRWRWSAPLAGVFLGAVLLTRWWPQRDSTTITVLPLAGGEAVWVDAPGRADDLLIDCGSADTAPRTLKPFLRAQGVNSLPLVILTHGDTRNVGGWPLIEREFNAQTTALPAGRFRSAAYREIAGELSARPGRARTLQRGDRVGAWRVLHPAAEDRFDHADDGALVLTGEFHGTHVVLLSDLGAAGQRLLLAREPELRADIVVAGLPEKGEPLGPPLLSALAPKLVIISDAASPATQRAGAALRNRLGAGGVPVHFTSGGRAGRVAIRPGGWIAEPSLDTP